MRPLTYLYKKFLLAKQLSPKVTGLSLAGAVALIVVACRIHQTQSVNASDPTAASDWNLNPIRTIANLAGADADEEPAIKILYGANGQPAVIGEFLEKSCNSSTEQSWRLRFASAFGLHAAHLSITEKSGGRGGATARIEGRELVFTTFDPAAASFIQAACKAVKDDQESLTISEPEHLKTVQKWLARIAPDCDFQSNAKTGWQCDLPTIEPGLALSEIDGIHRTMITRWNRQPYLISRRLAVTRSLAQSLRAQDTEQKLNTLCRVLSMALPSELPVALASRTWQESVCKAPVSNREKIAQIGLSKALGEIDFLRTLFEQNSKLGTLIVRIPRAQVPTRDIWISLKPAVEESTTTKPHHACWHPLFRHQNNMLLIARQVDLLSESDGTTCDSSKDVSEIVDSSKSFDPTRYLAESITSETEFVITNGQSKLLRLPMGTYTYIVRPHSEALSELETDPNITPSTGTIVWTKQRPQAIIKQW